MLLEHDIRKAIDRIHELETSLSAKDKINVDLTREKNELEASMLYTFFAKKEKVFTLYYW